MRENDSTHLNFRFQSRGDLAEALIRATDLNHRERSAVLAVAPRRDVLVHDQRRAGKTERGGAAHGRRREDQRQQTVRQQRVVHPCNREARIPSL